MQIDLFIESLEWNKAWNKKMTERLTALGKYGIVNK